MKTETTNRRNAYGVKSSIDLYRTIKGEHYICWMSFPSDERVAAYRKASVRCARRGVELFIHHEDEEKALAVDNEEERS